MFQEEIIVKWLITRQYKFTKNRFLCLTDLNGNFSISKVVKKVGERSDFKGKAIGKVQ